MDDLYFDDEENDYFYRYDDFMSGRVNIDT